MPEAAPTVAIEGVELLKAGTWPAITGPVTVTAADLADAVAASNDPEVDRAPLKLGHTGVLSTLGDSTPGLGWATNLRVSDDGQTLLGDLTDIPAALETPIKAGFKTRSAELAWGVKTVGGKTYRMVMDGLALLGVAPPAIRSLADLPSLYQPAPAALASAGLTAESHSTLSLYDVMPDAPDAAAQLAEAVRWAKESASRVAAQTGDITGLQAVFDALDAMAAADSRGLLSADPHAVPVPTPAPGGTMPDTTLKPEDIAKARTLLGLADDATDEQVTAKLGELGDLVAAGKAPAPEADPPAPTPELETAGTSALSAAVIGELKKAGLTVIADGALEQLQAGAAAGIAAHTNLAAQARESVLDDAYRAGKLGAGEPAKALRSTLSASLEKDFDGTKAVIDSLPAIVPVGEVGNDHTGIEHTTLAAAQEAAWDAEIRDLFGDEIATPAKEA